MREGHPAEGSKAMSTQGILYVGRPTLDDVPALEHPLIIGQVYPFINARAQHDSPFTRALEFNLR